MDDATDVIGGDHGPHGHLARVEVDIDLRHGGRPAEGGIGVAGVGLVVEMDAGVRREALIDAGRAPGPGVLAIADGERQPGALLDARLELARGVDDQAADDHRRPGRHRRAAVGHDRGVLGSHLDVIEVDAELFGHELREDRLGALAHLRVGDEDADDPLRAQLEAGHRADLLLARAGEAGAVPGQRQPDAARRAFPIRPTLALARRAFAHAFELGGLGGSLEDLLSRHPVVQDLAGRRHATGSVAVATADLQR